MSTKKQEQHNTEQPSRRKSHIIKDAEQQIEEKVDQLCRRKSKINKTKSKKAEPEARFRATESDWEKQKRQKSKPLCESLSKKKQNYQASEWKWRSRRKVKATLSNQLATRNKATMFTEEWKFIEVQQRNQKRNSETKFRRRFEIGSSSCHSSWKFEDRIESLRCNLKENSKWYWIENPRAI